MVDHLTLQAATKARQALGAPANVRDPRFAGGAKGDAVAYTVGITSGGSTVTRSSGAFPAGASIGKKIIIPGAGPAGVSLTTTITGRPPDSTTLTVADTATTTATGVAAIVATDDTAAFDAARAASTSVFVPAGIYIYDGAGLSGDGLNLAGAGRSTSFVRLGTGRSLVTSTIGVVSLAVRDLGVYGGFGAVRLTALGVSVHSVLGVENNDFQDYTGAAVSSLSVDQPNWLIRGNVFQAANDVTTLGVSLNADNAGSVIADNIFLNNAVHVKLGGNGGAAVGVRNNAFLRFTAYSGTPRTDLWITVTPAGSTATISRGLVVESNKFSVENLAPQDFKVLVADPDLTTGVDDATRLPKTSTASGLVFTAAKFVSNASSSQSPGTPAFLTLATDSAAGVLIDQLSLEGTLPPNIVKYLFEPSQGRTLIGNVIGQIAASELGSARGSQAFRYVSHPGHWTVRDDRGGFADPEGPLTYPGAGDLTGYVALQEGPVSGYSLAATATTSPVADAHGGTDAVTVTLAAADDGIYASLPTGSLTAGVPVFIEFDACSTPPTPLDGLFVATFASGVNMWTRVVPLTSTWRRYRLRWTPPTSSPVNTLSFSAADNSAGNFKLGRVRAYHAREPVNVYGELPNLSVLGDAIVGGAGALVGFYGDGGVVRPTVTGSRGGNAALANLLTALADMGLIVDGTS